MSYPSSVRSSFALCPFLKRRIITFDNGERRHLSKSGRFCREKPDCGLELDKTFADLQKIPCNLFIFGYCRQLSICFRAHINVRNFGTQLPVMRLPAVIASHGALVAVGRWNWSSSVRAAAPARCMAERTATSTASRSRRPDLRRSLKIIRSSRSTSRAISWRIASVVFFPAASAPPCRAVASGKSQRWSRQTHD